MSYSCYNRIILGRVFYALDTIVNLSRLLVIDYRNGLLIMGSDFAEHDVGGFGRTCEH
jgi:hypothetical protein